MDTLRERVLLLAGLNLQHRHDLLKAMGYEGWWMHREPAGWESPLGVFLSKEGACIGTREEWQAAVDAWRELGEPGPEVLRLAEAAMSLGESERRALEEDWHSEWAEADDGLLLWLYECGELMGEHQRYHESWGAAICSGAAADWRCAMGLWDFLRDFRAALAEHDAQQEARAEPDIATEVYARRGLEPMSTYQWSEGETAIIVADRDSSAWPGRGERRVVSVGPDGGPRLYNAAYSPRVLWPEAALPQCLPEEDVGMVLAYDTDAGWCYAWGDLLRGYLAEAERKGCSHLLATWTALKAAMDARKQHSDPSQPTEPEPTPDDSLPWGQEYLDAYVAQHVADTTAELEPVPPVRTPAPAGSPADDCRAERKALGHEPMRMGWSAYE